MITKNAMPSIISKKKRFPLGSTILTKSRAVASLTRLLLSGLLVRVSANLYSCATSLAPCCSKGGTFSILQGQLFIKEYPTASAHSGHFDSLVKELQLKKNFKPDIIFIDYLNICASQRYKAGSNVNSYTVVKSIAEELRGLAVKYNVPVVSATQTTRGGYGNSDVELTDTSESFGLPATADLMFALITNDDLESMGQILVKQLKNRYNDHNTHKKFVLGIDRAKMRLFDVEQSAQDDILDNPPDVHYNDNIPKKKFEGFSF